MASRGGIENLRPAEPGNTRAVTHGARADLQLAPRAAELRDQLAELVPAGSERDLPALTLLAWQFARIERANSWLAENDYIGHERKADSLLRKLSTWENSAARLCDLLGLTPTARAKLGFDLARTEAVTAERLQSVDGAGARAEARLTEGKG